MRAVAPRRDPASRRRLPSDPRRSAYSLVAGVATTLLTLALLAVLALAAPAAQADDGSSPDYLPARPSATRGYDVPKMPKICLKGAVPIPVTATVCKIRWHGAKRPTLFLFGDSHAWQQLPGLTAAADRRKVNLVASVFGGCPPIQVYRHTKGGGYRTVCEANSAKAMAWVTKRAKAKLPTRVLVGANWGSYLSRYQHEDQIVQPAYARDMARIAHRGWPKLFARLARLKMPTDVIAQGPVVPLNAASCPAGDDPYRCAFSKADALVGERQAHAYLMRQVRHIPGRPRYIDANSQGCGNLLCYGRVRGLDVYYDRNHFSATWAATLAPYFLPSARALR